MIAILLMLAVWVPLGALVGIMGIPWTMLTKDVGWMYRAAQWVTRAGLRAAGVTVEVVGLERVPVGRSCIFMANHVSNMDPPVLLPVLPGRSSVMLKKELMKVPIMGYAMKIAKFVPVERTAKRDAAQASVAAASDALTSGLNMLIFVEGTRSKDGRLQGFKKGPFYLAQQTGAPVVPVVVSGTERMMRKGELRLYPGTARVEFLAAIEPREYGTREELMAAVRGAMVAALPGGMRPVEG